MSFHKKEIIDLLKAWIAISIAFGIFMWRVYGFSFGKAFGIALLTVGIGFVAHELSHRYAARKFKVYAEFRSNDIMLVLAIVLSFTGFVFAAPGAVWFSGYVNKRQRGIISMSGPLANIVIAIIFIPLIFVIPDIAIAGLWINAFLAFFNMLPFKIFDGYKVMEWNKAIYAGLLVVSLGLTFLSFLF